MQEQGIIFLFMLIGQIIIVMQINFKIRVGYNFYTNKGKIVLKILRFVVLDEEFSFEKGFIKVKKKNGKIKLLPLNIKDPETYKYVGLEQFIFRKIYLKRFNAYINFGSKQDAFATSLCCGSAMTVTSAIGSYIHTKKQGCIVRNKIYPVFNKDYLKFNVKVSGSICLFDLSWSIGEFNYYRKKKESKK